MNRSLGAPRFVFALAWIGLLMMAPAPLTGETQPRSGSESIDSTLKQLEQEIDEEDDKPGSSNKAAPTEDPASNAADSPDNPPAAAGSVTDASAGGDGLSMTRLLRMYWQPIWTALIGGLALGLLGVYVVARRIVFVSAALSQVSALGITLGFLAVALLGLHGVIADLIPPLAAAALAIVTVWWLVRVGESPSFPRDSVLGVAFVVPMALVLIVAPLITAEMHEVEHVLHGSAVAVSLPNVIAVTVGGVLVLAAQLLAFRGFLFASLDPDVARTQGVPVGVLDAVLFGSIALMTGLVTRALGALPTFALTILPALGAIRLRVGLKKVFAVAAIAGGLSGAGGFLLSSFVTDWSVGASQALVAGAFCIILRLTGRMLA
jgi:zinc transport system permease protein